MVKIETRMGGGSGGGASTGASAGGGTSPNYMKIAGEGLQAAGSAGTYSPPPMPQLQSQFQGLTIPTGEAGGLIPTPQSQSLDIDAIIRLLTGK